MFSADAGTGSETPEPRNPNTFALAVSGLPFAGMFHPLAASALHYGSETP